MSIEISHLTHTYMQGGPFERTAIEDVSLNIRDGEFVGLIGHTGSGKSTLIMHLNGLIKPTSGSIHVDGLDLMDKNTSLRDVRKKVGLVFQYPEYQLFEETILKDVMFGPKNLGLSDQEAEERARHALGQVGLTDESLYEKSPFELSGGQKRRVAIAGVLAMRPTTLILDEPTAGLDPRGREEILSLVKRYHEEEKVTLIMVSHSMTDVSRLCSRILVMDHSHLVMDGTPDEVFMNGDRLMQAGLALPPCAELAERLRGAGFEIPADAYRPEELKQAILRNLGRSGENA